MKQLEPRPGVGRIFLWILVAFSLAYYAFLVIDFVMHPLAPGAQSALGIPFLFRWLSMLAGTFTIVVAFFVMRRVRGNIIGPLLLIYGVGNAGWSRADPNEYSLWAFWLYAISAVYFFGIALPAGLGMFYYFPSGRVYPPWLQKWMPLILGAMALTGLFALMGSPPTPQQVIPNALYVSGFEPFANLIGITFPAIILGAFLSIFFRYRGSSTREQLQLKWLLWFLAVLFLLAFVVFAVLTPARLETIISAQGVALLQTAIFVFWQSLAALAFGIAILRHKLWDIDIIIRKTLTYTIVVTLLAIVYFAIVILLQQLFANLTGLGNNEIITVLSTLAIAALFVPLRNRIQNAIDKRFYRRKYDAQKVLQEFAETVRDETDLDKLTAKLIEVVNETMQPKSVSVWLKRESGRMSESQAIRDEG